MKKRTEAGVLRIASSVLLVILIGLLALLTGILQKQRTAEASRLLLADTQLYRSAEDLAQELEEQAERLKQAELAESAEQSDGGAAAAYHDAKEAAEAARILGREGPAGFFEEIARRLLEGGDPAAEAESVRRFLTTGKTSGDGDPLPSAPDTAESETSAGQPELREPSEPAEPSDEPRILSKIRLEKAKSCAQRLFGKGTVLHLSERSRDGLLVFTCANAYAVIDEKSGLPVEASLSLAPAPAPAAAAASSAGTARLSEGECASRAKAFLAAFFPMDLAEAAELCRIAPAENGQILRAEFFGGGRYFAVDVRRDTGRITGLRT